MHEQIAHQFEVFCDVGEVWIGQCEDGGDTSDVIRIHPGQVELLCSFLKQAVEQLKKESE